MVGVSLSPEVDASLVPLSFDLDRLVPDADGIFAPVSAKKASVELRDRIAEFPVGVQLAEGGVVGHDCLQPGAWAEPQSFSLLPAPPPHAYAA